MGSMDWTDLPAVVPRPAHAAPSSSQPALVGFRIKSGIAKYKDIGHLFCHWIAPSLFLPDCVDHRQILFGRLGERSNNWIYEPGGANILVISKFRDSTAILEVNF
jgi:hypothetical protein